MLQYYCPFYHASSYSCFLRYTLLERLFVNNNASNLDHKLITIFSSITLYMTSFARHNWIILAAFRSISFQSSSNIPTGFVNFSCKVLWRCCYTSSVFTLFCHKPKFSLPLNFSTSNLVAELPIFNISSYHQLVCSGTNCCENRQLWDQLLRPTIRLRH